MFLSKAGCRDCFLFVILSICVYYSYTVSAFLSVFSAMGARKMKKRLQRVREIHRQQHFTVLVLF